MTDSNDDRANNHQPAPEEEDRQDPSVPPTPPRKRHASESIDEEDASTGGSNNDPPPPKQQRTLHEGGGGGGSSAGGVAPASAVEVAGAAAAGAVVVAPPSSVPPERNNKGPPSPSAATAEAEAAPESLFLLSHVGGDGGSTRNVLGGHQAPTHPNHDDHHSKDDGSAPVAGVGMGEDINIDHAASNHPLAGAATPPPEILAAAAAAAAEVEAVFGAGGPQEGGAAAVGVSTLPPTKPPKEDGGDGATPGGPSKKRGRPPAAADGPQGSSAAKGGGRGGAASASALPSKQACISEPFRRSFNDMLYELLKFRVNKGHLRVPPTHGNLGLWVYRIRVQHQALQRDPARRDVADLTRERMDVLNSLDFCWDLHKYETEKNWNDRYAELLQWKEVHGHCNVPQSDPSLGKWVKMQRDYYNNTAEGRTQRKGSLTQEKIEKLEAIGFEWRLLKMVGWDKRFDELCEWKRVHGHCNVPTQTTGSLGRWVSKQRIQMTYRKNGEYSQLSDDRIEKLNSIGFVWNTKLKSELADEMEQPPHGQYLYDDSMAI